MTQIILLFVIAAENAALLALKLAEARRVPAPRTQRREDREEKALREGIRAILTYGGDRP